MERYEEASSNQYSEDVQVLLRVKEQGDGKSLAYNTHPASFKPPVEVKRTSMWTINTWNNSAAHKQSLDLLTPPHQRARPGRCSDAM